MGNFCMNECFLNSYYSYTILTEIKVFLLVHAHNKQDD